VAAVPVSAPADREPLTAWHPDYGLSQKRRNKIEEAPGLYRQITLNMVGVFLERLGDRPTANPERLIQRPS